MRDDTKLVGESWGQPRKTCEISPFWILVCALGLVKGGTGLQAESGLWRLTGWC